MRKSSSATRFVCAMLFALLTLSTADASYPPGAILRPAGLQWYVRGAHNAQLNEYFVVWEDNAMSAIRGMPVSSTGVQAGVPWSIDSDSTSIAPDIAYNPNSPGYLVVWSDGGVDAGDILGRFLTSQGQPASATFTIFRGAGAQTLPRVVYNPTDNVYLVVWYGYFNVRMQIVHGNSANPTLLLPSAPSLENTTIAVFPHSPSVDWNAFTNKFLIAWTSLGSGNDLVRAQIFNGDGSASTQAFTLVNAAQVNDKNPSVAANSRNGEFLVSYDVGAGIHLNVRALIVNSNATIIKPSFPIATTVVIPDWRNHAAYNRLADTYLVTYNTGRGCGGPCDDVLGRAVSSDGTAGPEFGVANDNFLQSHGSDDGFGSWGDLVSSTTEPAFFDLYQVGNDDINGGIVPFGTVFTDDPPFGIFETPSDGATGVAGAIAVTGWALDDVEVTGVQIYRDPIAGEGTSIVFVGDAVFVEGARPDVEAAYPGYPNNTRAGWGYMLLTYGLPNQGNGAWVLHARTTDSTGQVVTLGTKSITVDNANSVLPFGTIDTPSQGGTTTGLFRNWGWVLTPQPNMIPLNGSTIQVYVGGALLGTVNYGFSRPDIQALFPGYQNTDTAVGYFDLDTTAYADGVYTISWYAVDDDGNADGIGSRFFIIDNNP